MLKGPHQLKEGRCYFSLEFCEQEMRFPCVQTYVYIGKNLKNRKGEKWYFQDAESYVTRGGASSFPKAARAALVMAGEDAVNHMFDLAGLAEALARLAAANG